MLREPMTVQVWTLDLHYCEECGAPLDRPGQRYVCDACYHMLVGSYRPHAKPHGGRPEFRMVD